jgi:SAM-dependent methyltransferase
VRIDPIPRTRCVLCDGDALSPLHAFRDFPVWMGCTDAPPADDPRHDMRWTICEACGTIQLSSLVPLDVLYARSHNSGVVGGLWAAHHRAFADFVLEHAPRAVLEIGGGHGLLSMHCHERDPSIDWTILEPNPTPRPGCRARYVRGFFDRTFHADRPVDTVVHSHLFEHLYAPADFLAELGRVLPPGGRHLFSMPNLPAMLDRCYTNCINFEHTWFADLPQLEAAFARAGLRIVERRPFLDDHSVFFATERVDPLDVPIPSATAANRARWARYVEHHRTLVDALNAQIGAHDGPVHLFGAHVFSQYLFAFGLDEGRIASILDNDPAKQGLRLCGTGRRVDAPRVLEGERDALVILRAGVYNDEIRRDIVGRINPDVRFI